MNRQNGRFRNFMTHARSWLEESGSEDSHGRALWALGSGAGRSRNEGHRKLCTQMFERGLAAMEGFSSPRAWAFALLGIQEFLRRAPGHADAKGLREALTRRLIRLWQDCATETWPWFEPSATYDNPRLCQALLISGQEMPDPQALEIGLKSLNWLVSVQKAPAGHFRPIGNQGFYERDGAHSDFDQQPVEAQAMVAACLEALRGTQDLAWSRRAKWAFEWFLGRNDLGVPVYDSGTGGCGDGLHPDQVSENQGAESTLAFHIARAEMSSAQLLVGPSAPAAPGPS
jgi:hypothetical protein